MKCEVRRLGIVHVKLPFHMQSGHHSRENRHTQACIIFSLTIKTTSYFIRLYCICEMLWLLFFTAVWHVYWLAMTVYQSALCLIPVLFFFPRPSVSHFFPLQVRQFEEEISRAPLVVMDGNLPQPTINYVLDLCGSCSVPGQYNTQCFALLSHLYRILLLDYCLYNYLFA